MLTLGFASAPDWWGLSLTETLVLLGVFLILVDVFFLSDVPSLIAYVLISVAVVHQFDVHILYKLIIGVPIWFGLIALHYTAWKHIIQKISNQIIAPDRFHAGAEGLVGSIGQVQEHDNIKMVEIKGDLWNYEYPTDLKVGTAVRVESVKDGVLTIKPVEDKLDA